MALLKFSERFSAARRVMPAQFWLLMGGGLISATGGAMVWPFLSSYLKGRLDVPLTTVTLLLTLNSVSASYSPSWVGCWPIALDARGLWWYRSLPASFIFS